MSNLYIAVIGPGRCDGEEAQTAEKVGELLARRGAVVVCGGLGGAMEAVARGARRQGGTVLGLLPGPDRADGNPFLSHAIPTGLGEGRNALIVRAADGVLAVGGGFGTCSEIALARRLDKPVVGIRSWRVIPPGDEAAGPVPGIHEARDAAAAVDLIIKLVNERDGEIVENREPIPPTGYTIEVSFREEPGGGRWTADCPAAGNLTREEASLEAALTGLREDLAAHAGGPVDLSVRIGSALAMDAESCGGRVRVAETELTVARLLHTLAEDSFATLREHYPILGERDLKAAMDFAIRVVNGIRILPAAE